MSVFEQRLKSMQEMATAEKRLEEANSRLSAMNHRTVEELWRDVQTVCEREAKAGNLTDEDTYFLLKQPSRGMESRFEKRGMPQDVRQNLENIILRSLPRTCFWCGRQIKWALGAWLWDTRYGGDPRHCGSSPDGSVHRPPTWKECHGFISWPAAPQQSVMSDLNAQALRAMAKPVTMNWAKPLTSTIHDEQVMGRQGLLAQIKRDFDKAKILMDPPWNAGNFGEGYSSPTPKLLWRGQPISPALEAAIRNDPIAAALHGQSVSLKVELTKETDLRKRAEAALKGKEEHAEGLYAANAKLAKARDEALEALETARHDLEESEVEVDARGHKIAALEGLNEEKSRDLIALGGTIVKLKEAAQQVTCCGCEATVPIKQVGCMECSGKASRANAQAIFVAMLVAVMVLATYSVMLSAPTTK